MNFPDDYLIPGIEPYHVEDAGIIYCADCRDILPHLPKVDLVLTDPPYNYGKDYGLYKDNLSELDYQNFISHVFHLGQDIADNQFWVAPRYRLFFYLGLMPESHLIIIPRQAQGPSRAGWGDQFEIALAIGKPNKQIADLWNGIRLKAEGYFFKEDTFGHPGYTPYPIMFRAAKYLCQEILCDPFVGTGTALRVAKDLGRKFIGIEISEEYCKIAVKRLRQGVLKFD